MKRTQFPVRLAFAMTIHKSQGQSLNKVGLYLLNGCFTHGQLYVALSRTTSCQNIHVLCSPEQIGTNEDGTIKWTPRGYTKNIVYKEALNFTEGTE